MYNEKKPRGLYHVFERRYLNFSSRTFLKILVIHTAPTVKELKYQFEEAKGGKDNAIESGEVWLMV